MVQISTMSSNVRNLKALFESKASQTIIGDLRIQEGIANTQSTRKDKLGTTLLKSAGCDASNNPVVQKLWRRVTEYNTDWQHPSTIGEAGVANAVRRLDKIYATCATYMLSLIHISEPTRQA